MHESRQEQHTCIERHAAGLDIHPIAAPGIHLGVRVRVRGISDGISDARHHAPGGAEGPRASRAWRRATRELGTGRRNARTLPFAEPSSAQPRSAHPGASGPPLGPSWSMADAAASRSLPRSLHSSRISRQAHYFQHSYIHTSVAIGGRPTAAGRPVRSRVDVRAVGAIALWTRGGRCRRDRRLLLLLLLLLGLASSSISSGVGGNVLGKVCHGDATR